MPKRRSWGTIRRLPSRRYQASYVGPDMVRHNSETTYRAKIDAEAWLASERRLVELRAWTSPAIRATRGAEAGETVAEAAARWIAQRRLKPGTRHEYEGTLRRHIADTTLGRLPLRQATRAAVRAWYAGMDKAAPTARAKAYALLHAVLATAVDDDILPANPVRIPGAMVTETRRQPVILDAGEVDALARAMRPASLAAAILIAAWCGPRYGELVELRRRDITAGCSILNVARGVTHTGGVCRIDTPKSGRSRAVVIPPHIRPAITSHLRRYVGKTPDALLFPPPDGCHLSDKTFRRHYFDALDAIGRDGDKLPRPTIHDLRHFAGTQAARVGSLRETMDRLGHSTVKASLRYQGIVDGRAAELAAELSRLAASPPTDKLSR